MKQFLRCFWFLFAFALTRSGQAEDAFASPSQLTATLTNGNSVVLRWKNNATAEGGVWIEYTTPGYHFIKLASFGSDANARSFVHSDLAPQTKFIYRVVPFFGPPTKPLEIATGTPSPKALMLPEGPIRSSDTSSSGENVEKYSLKTGGTFTRAIPTAFTAVLSSPVSVDLHWQDRAADEEGYLVEIAPRVDGEFHACALLPPDATSFRKSGLPAETKCYFRVRAFFYGKESAEVSTTTETR